MPTDAPTDPFLELLTDALRAGPGSPSWRDVVNELRQKGAKEADEYRLLISTRESLEGGREYRNVRAGAGFTRRLMDKLSGEQQKSAGLHGLPLANVIAIICGLAILVALACVVYRAISPSAGPDPQAIEQLAGDARHFLTDISTASFAGALPDGWKQIGSLSLDFNGALRPGPEQDMAGGGIYATTEIPGDQSFMIEANITVPKTNDAPSTGSGQVPSTSSGQAVWLQVFVSAGAGFSSDRATSAHEIVWSLQGGSQSVVVDGNVNPITLPPQTGTFPVRIIVSQKLAIVQVGQRGADGRVEYRQAWAGEHFLGTGGRYAGVRFIRTQPSNSEPPAVVSIHLAKG